MTATLPSIRCGFGLGNRVAAIAHALTMLDEIRFVWRVNWQCPASHEQIFPNGLKRVQFVTDTPKRYATKVAGVPLHHFKEWASPDAIKKAYASVMSAMVGEAGSRPDCGILGRFHRFATCPIRASEALAEQAAVHGAGNAFILADTHRSAIARALEKRGVHPVFPNGPEMDDERDRTPERIIQFCSDWKTFLASRHVVSVGGVSSLIYPAFAASGCPPKTALQILPKPE